MDITQEESKLMLSSRRMPYGLVGIFFGLVVILLSLFFSFEKITTPGPLNDPHITIISSGQSTSLIAHTLYEEGIIDSPYLFTLLVRVSQKKIKAGEYKFLPHMSLGQVVSLVNEGRLVTHKLTIPEGLTSTEIVQLLRNNPLLDGLIPDTPPEGSLFPTTFRIHRGQDRQSLLNRMALLMERARYALDSQSLEGSLSSQERLILASIIEKETYHAHERAHISGVFHNRLKRKMPLQADPCVSYALTQGTSSLKRPLTRKDLSIDSPYNTYLNQGLPPTPICNPGAKALEAAYCPIQTQSLYFVVGEDGTHQFSKDYASHARHHQKLRSHRKKTLKS